MTPKEAHVVARVVHQMADAHVETHQMIVTLAYTLALLAFQGKKAEVSPAEIRQGVLEMIAGVLDDVQQISMSENLKRN